MSVERVALRQQRDLGQIIEAAFSLYLQNFWRFFSIASILIPFGILTGVLIALLPAFDDPADEEELVRALVIALVVLLPILQLFAQWLAALAIMAAVADLDSERAPELSHAMRQRGPDFSRAYGVVLNRFWTLVGASLRAGFHIFLFFITIIGIPWAIQRSVRWLFIHQAVIFDGTSARAALSYSADAVAGRWWRTLGIAIILWIIVQVPALVIGGLVGIAPVLISGTASAVVTAAILPFGVIAMTLLYLDLKTRRETDVSR